jgi:hypothetical protein
MMAQSDKLGPFVELSPKEELLMEMANECVNLNRYDRIQRLGFYPFNKNSGIKIISFKDDEFIPINNRKVDYSRIYEYQDLSTDQIDTLSDILYNLDYDPNYKPRTRIAGEYKCYEPRNGILFLNAKGEVFEFIEICFECHKTRLSSKRIIEGAYCNQKFDLLKNFFRTAGISYVEDERYAIRPYQDLLKLDTIDLLSAFKKKLDAKLGNAEISSRLTAVESKIYFLLNARGIYYRDLVGSGLVNFYYKDSGSFFLETANALAEVGAGNTLAVLKSSLTDWYGGKVPKSIMSRRKELLAMANDVFPKWQALQEELYFHDEKDPDNVLTAKEDLNGIIFGYIMAQKELLKENY